MASKAQLERVAAMNAARARNRADREAAEALPARATAPKTKVVGRPRKDAESAIERVRRLRAEADALETADAGDDSPQATIARARARTKVKASPTVRRSEVSRDPVSGRVAVQGRDGKMITRRVTNVEDKFYVAKEDIPEGWSYQWIALSVEGEPQRRTVASFRMGGWEEVLMDRYPGRYGPTHTKDGKVNKEHIVVDELGLYERPIELTEEARGEEIAAARSLIKTRNDQFVPRLPDARSQRLRGTGLQARRSLEPMPSDVGRPGYEIAVDEGL
jgi:hypothetical protein